MLYKAYLPYIAPQIRLLLTIVRVCKLYLLTYSLKTHINESVFSPPAYADNVALPAFARRTPLLLQQSIDISFAPDPQQQTRRPMLGQTDGYHTVSLTLLRILCGQ